MLKERWDQLEQELELQRAEKADLVAQKKAEKEAVQAQQKAEKALAKTLVREQKARERAAKVSKKKKVEIEE